MVPEVSVKFWGWSSKTEVLALLLIFKLKHTTEITDDISEALVSSCKACHVRI